MLSPVVQQTALCYVLLCSRQLQLTQTYVKSCCAADSSNSHRPVLSLLVPCCAADSSNSHRPMLRPFCADTALQRASMSRNTPGNKTTPGHEHTYNFFFVQSFNRSLIHSILFAPAVPQDINTLNKMEKKSSHTHTYTPACTDTQAHTDTHTHRCRGRQIYTLTQTQTDTRVRHVIVQMTKTYMKTVSIRYPSAFR